MSYISAENDEKIVTIGGIITNVRSILTKAGAKMAFVKIENKSAEQEIVVFPKVFEEHGAKIVQDNVIRVTGRVNAKDKDGRPTSDIKLLAESVEVISDEALEAYQSTGARLPAPKAAPRRGRGSYSRASSVSRGGARAGSGGRGNTGGVEDASGGMRSAAARSPLGTRERSEAAAPSARGDGPDGRVAGSDSASTVVPKDPRSERLYCLIQDPDNTDTLSEIKHLCDLHPGVQEIVLVLKENGEKRPLKMPFRVSADAELTTPLKTLLGEKCVVVQ